MNTEQIVTRDDKQIDIQEFIQSDRIHRDMEEDIGCLYVDDHDRRTENPRQALAWLEEGYFLRRFPINYAK